MLRFPFLLSLSLLTGGCASVAGFNGLALDDDDGVYVSVPAVRQSQHHACGAASLAAVAAHWGVSLAEFKSRHPHLPDDTTGKDLQLLAEDLGLRAFVYQGSFDDLRDNLGKGRPLIVMLPKPLLPSGGLIAAMLLNAWNQVGFRPPHWVIVTGFLGEREVIVHDPASGPLLIKQENFRKWWAEMDNLCVLVAAPSTHR